MSNYFDVSNPPQNESGECLAGCNFFQMEILEEDGVSQLSLKWKSDDFSKIESKHCVRCNTTELNEKLKDLVENLVNGKKFKIKFQWIKGHDGITENERCDELANNAAFKKNLEIDIGYEKSYKPNELF